MNVSDHLGPMQYDLGAAQAVFEAGKWKDKRQLLYRGVDEPPPVVAGPNFGVVTFACGIYRVESTSITNVVDCGCADEYPEAKVQGVREDLGVCFIWCEHSGNVDRHNEGDLPCHFEEAEWYIVMLRDLRFVLAGGLVDRYFDWRKHLEQALCGDEIDCHSR